MRKVAALQIFSILVILLLSYGACQKIADNRRDKYAGKQLKDSPSAKNAIELEKKFSFPSDNVIKNGIFLAQPCKIANDPSNNIYVLDSKEDKILKFDSSGNLLKQIGQKGQGPCEFSTPNNMLVTKKLIVVNDMRNSRVQFLDLEGNYVRSFGRYKGWYSMAINNEGLIFSAPRITYMTDGPCLIDVLSQEGKLLYTFGNPVNYRYYSSILNAVKIDINKKAELYVAFLYNATVRKYSQEGNLLAEFKIHNNMMQEMEKLNIKRGASVSNKKKVGFFNVIDAIKATQDGFYILHHSPPRVEIFEFDNQGNQQYAHWIQSDNCFFNDFLVVDEAKEKLFYLLQAYPDLKIDVFGRKH